MVTEFGPSHGVNFWVRCASGNVYSKVHPNGLRFKKWIVADLVAGADLLGEGGLFSSCSLAKIYRLAKCILGEHIYDPPTT